MACAAPDLVPVNQISRPLGDHASPSTLLHPDESVRAFPARSTSTTDPAVSPITGCEMTAIASPDGENRMCVMWPGAGSYSVWPSGYSRLSFPPRDWTTANPDPSGVQSAARTLSASWRGTPPASG